MASTKTVDNGTAEVATVPVTAATLDEKALYLSGVATTGDDADAMARAIVARIMEADTAEDIFGGPGTLLSAEDITGKAFTLLDVEYRESDIKPTPQNPNPGPGVYALLHISPWGATNEVLVTCGARNVMAAAFRAKQLDMLPRGPLTIVEGNKTRAGFVPLWLQDMDRAKADATNGITDLGTPLPFADRDGEPF